MVVAGAIGENADTPNPITNLLFLLLARRHVREQDHGCQNATTRAHDQHPLTFIRDFPFGLCLELLQGRNAAHFNKLRPPRVQGVVILECTISPQGKVTDVKVLRGIPLLDQAAIDAVKQWVYTPTLLNGVPVPVIMTVTVNFRLS